ncbi:MAG: hypothetical protein AAF827_12105 [Cyanobacteria bacterium P01_D01_bin.6]
MAAGICSALVKARVAGDAQTCSQGRMRHKYPIERRDRANSS